MRSATILGLAGLASLAAATAIGVPSRSAESTGGGVPVIGVSPDTLDFGERVVGGLTSLSAIVGNGGTADLILGELTVDHSDFSVGGQSGGIPPGTIVESGSTLVVPVFFRPSQAGSISARMTIPSNDLLNPEVGVDLIGFGLTDPPTIQVSPDSIHEIINRTDTTTVVEREITLANVGDLPLDFAISVLPLAGAGAPRARGTGDLDGVRILWDRTHGQNTWVGTRDDIVADLESRGATVDELLPDGGGDQVTLARLAGYHVYWTKEALSGWSGTEISTLNDWIRVGGSMLLVGDNTASLSWYDDVLEGIGANVRYARINGAGDQPTTSIPGRDSGHPTCASVIRLYVALNPATLTSFASPADSLVKDPGGAHIAAAEQIGAGRIVVLSDDDMLHNNAINTPGMDNRLFGRQIFLWFVETLWASVDIPTGTVPRDSSVAITLTLDSTGLIGGTHDLLVRFFSNDLVRPEVDLPVHLLVEGVPTIDIEPASYAFGSVPVQTAVDTTLIVRNLGSEPLTVQGVTTSGEAFQIDFPTLLIPGGGADTVDVTFFPTAHGADSGSVVLVSDSGSEPDPDSVVVAWDGWGKVNCQLDCLSPSLRPASVDASHGYRFWMDFTLTDNPAAFTAFGFQVEYDPDLLVLADSAHVLAGSLTPGYIFQAVENEPGRATCGGFGSPAVPAGATGSLIKLFFEVDCDTCSPGTMGDVLTDRLEDGLIGVIPCCGEITIGSCPTGDGDVNADSTLDVTDALCALKIWANGESVPEDPSCIGFGACEVARADADCSGGVSPGDAFSIWEHVICDLTPTAVPCLGTVAPDSNCLSGLPEPDSRGAPGVAWGTPRAGPGGTTVFPLVSGDAAPPVWGTIVAFDPNGWDWMAGEAAGDAAGFAASSPAQGVVRVGGFGGTTRGPGSELARLVLRRRPGVDSGSGLRIEEVLEAALVGPAVVRPPGAATVPTVSGLETIGPIPAGESVTITFGVASSGAVVDLTIHDVAGRRVRSVAAGPRGGGRHELAWDGRDDSGRSVAAGIYFVRLRIDAEVWTRKAVLVR